MQASVAQEVLILPVEWGWRSGQTHLNSDARIADEGRPQGGGGHPQGVPLPDSGSLTWVCPNLMPIALPRAGKEHANVANIAYVTPFYRGSIQALDRCTEIIRHLASRPRRGAGIFFLRCSTCWTEFCRIECHFEDLENATFMEVMSFLIALGSISSRSRKVGACE